MATTAGDELVDWVDEDDRVIGVVTRRRMRAENLRHRSVAVIVTSDDGRLLVHRRSPAKDMYPGWWDIGAGGVVGAGETHADAAMRELAEEVGIVDAALESLGVSRHDDARSREICGLFRVVYDGPFDFADGEVVEARLVDPAAFADLARSEPFLPGSLAMLLPRLPDFAAPGTP